MKALVSILIVLILSPLVHANDFGSLESVDFGTLETCDFGSIESDQSSEMKPIVLTVSKPATAVCQCQGSKRGVCFCLQNGVKCGCHTAKGSVWNLNDAGRAVSKTGEYVDPRVAYTPKLKQVTLPKSVESAVSGDGFPTTVDASGRVHWEQDGQKMHTVYPITEGTTIVGGLIYQGGKVRPIKMAVDLEPAKKTGRWVTYKQCTSQGCYTYRKWVEE